MTRDTIKNNAASILEARPKLSRLEDLQKSSASSADPSAPRSQPHQGRSEGFIASELYAEILTGML
jgi:hypothetical protein